MCQSFFVIGSKKYFNQDKNSVSFLYKIEDIYMKMNKLKKLIIAGAVLFTGIATSFSVINASSRDNSIKAAEATGDPYIELSTVHVVGTVDTYSDVLTATLVNYTGSFKYYIGGHSGTSGKVKSVNDSISGNTVSFQLDFLKAGVTGANIIFATNEEQLIAERSIEVFCESNGDYSISRFADKAYHNLYLEDKGYLEFVAPSEYPVVVSATTSNSRCTISSIEDKGTHYNFNYVTPDYYWDDNDYGACMLTVTCENPDSHEQSNIIIYVFVADYDSEVLIKAYDFAISISNVCSHRNLDDWNSYVRGTYLMEVPEVIPYLKNIDYEMPDRNTVVKINNNVPYCIVHAMSQYDYMVETYGYLQHNDLNRDTSKARIAASGTIDSLNKMSESDSTSFIIVSVIAFISLSGFAIYLLKKRKTN